MRFCPRCGVRLLLSSGRKLAYLECPKCKYKETVVERTVVVQAPERSAIAVLGEEEQSLRTMPKAKVECSRCSNTEAYWWTAQLRGSDESSTQFFRCTKCGFTWREVS